MLHPYNQEVGSDRYDVVIVGGGPAGLSAALVLGRSARRVLLIDAGNPRNARSLALHGYLTRDGINPTEFLRIAREEIKRYGVEFHEGTVMGAERKDAGFEVIMIDGSRMQSRKLLLATGVVDRVPQIDGLDQFYGKSVHHCPYCDAWEHKDAPIAVYGHGHPGAGLALAMLNWSRDVVLCTDGHTKIAAADREMLARRGIEIYDQRIARVEGAGGQIERIVFVDNTVIARHAIFFNTGNVQRSALPQGCGCETTRKGAVKTTRGQKSSVKGIWVCGDASEDTQFVVVAAAEGAKAAMAIDKELQLEDQT